MEYFLKAAPYSYALADPVVVLGFGWLFSFHSS